METHGRPGLPYQNNALVVGGNLSLEVAEVVRQVPGAGDRHTAVICGAESTTRLLGRNQMTNGHSPRLTTGESSPGRELVCLDIPRPRLPVSNRVMPCSSKTPSRTSTKDLIAAPSSSRRFENGGMEPGEMPWGRTASEARAGGRDTQKFMKDAAKPTTDPPNTEGSRTYLRCRRGGHDWPQRTPSCRRRTQV